jgi:mannose/fructose/N-acetylgalactosamine-specific phosphotransferase system component IIB
VSRVSLPGRSVPILLYRVDERLIHGQVVLGWGIRLRPDRYIVVDDEVAGSPWEQELYLLGVPEDVETVFETVVDARGRLPDWRADSRASVLLTRAIPAMRELGRGGGMEETRVNLGGIHHAPGKERVLPYLHLSPDEIRLLEEMAAEGVEISAQDLPGSARIPLGDLLE